MKIKFFYSSRDVLYFISSNTKILRPLINKIFSAYSLYKSLVRKIMLYMLSVEPTKWSKTLKQFAGYCKLLIASNQFLNSSTAR